MTQTVQEPETVSVEGVGEVPLAELKERYRKSSDFDRANHQRAAEIKEMRAAWEKEAGQLRAQMEAERQRIAAERTAHLEAIKAVAQRGAPEPAPEAPYDPSAAIAQTDFLDPEAPRKLGQAVAMGFEAERQRLERSFEERLAAAEKGWNAKLDQLTSAQSQQANIERAKANVNAANEQTFQRYLAEKHPDVVAKLTPAEMAELREEYRSQAHKARGKWVEGQWQFNEKAVEAAVWAAPSTRRLLLAREVGSARAEGLQGRRAGEAATASTPLRGVQRMGLSADELGQRADNINRDIIAGRTHPLDVDAALPDDPVKLREIYEARRAARFANP